jgi:hypothetical protein
VLSFTPLPLYPRGNSSHYPLYRRLGEPQSGSERYGEDKNLLMLLGIEPRLLSRPARVLISIQTEQSRRTNDEIIVSLTVGSDYDGPVLLEPQTRDDFQGNIQDLWLMGMILD